MVSQSLVRRSQPDQSPSILRCHDRRLAISCQGLPPQFLRFFSLSQSRFLTVEVAQPPVSVRPAGSHGLGEHAFAPRYVERLAIGGLRFLNPPGAGQQPTQAHISGSQRRVQGQRLLKSTPGSRRILLLPPGIERAQAGIRARIIRVEPRRSLICDLRLRLVPILFPAGFHFRQPQGCFGIVRSQGQRFLQQVNCLIKLAGCPQNRPHAAEGSRAHGAVRRLKCQCLAVSFARRLRFSQPKPGIAQTDIHGCTCSVNRQRLFIRLSRFRIIAQRQINGAQIIIGKRIISRVPACRLHRRLVRLQRFLVAAQRPVNTCHSFMGRNGRVVQSQRPPVSTQGRLVAAGIPVNIA